MEFKYVSMLTWVIGFGGGFVAGIAVGAAAMYVMALKAVKQAYQHVKENRERILAEVDSEVEEQTPVEKRPAIMPYILRPEFIDTLLEKVSMGARDSLRRTFDEWQHVMDTSNMRSLPPRTLKVDVNAVKGSPHVLCEYWQEIVDEMRSNRLTVTESDLAPHVIRVSW